MTDEELNAIRARMDKASPGPWKTSLYSRVDARNGHMVAVASHARNGEFIARVPEDIGVLLAEVERLRALAHDEHAVGQAFVDRINELEAENAALREVMQAVASLPMDAYGHRGDAGPWVTTCPLCFAKVGAEFTHTTACPVTKARALLAGDQKARDTENTAIALRTMTLSTSAENQMQAMLTDPTVPQHAGETLPGISADELMRRIEADHDGECPRCHCDAWTPGRISADCACACHQMPASESGKV